MISNLQIGKSKVFLRAGQMAELDAHRTRVLGEAARMIQGKVRTRLTRERYVLMQRASVQIQANWRSELWRDGFIYPFLFTLCFHGYGQEISNADTVSLSYFRKYCRKHMQAHEKGGSCHQNSEKLT